MSSAQEKKCAQNVLQLKQKRSREKGKLRALLDRVQKKLDKAGQDEEEPTTYLTAPVTVDDVPKGQEVALVSYYLLQPKAESAPPRNLPYLG